MQIIKYIVSLCLLILTTSVARAETATSGNLLPNAGAGQGSQNTTDSYTPDKVGSGQTGWTLNNGQLFTNEFEVPGQGSISADGTLLGITTTTQSGNSHTTTENSLDGGVTLNSISEVQNCEWTSSSYRCGSASTGGGARDTFTNTIKILDANDNVLAVTTFTRNNDAGYNSTSHTYTDTVSYTDTGSRKYDWEWEGTDGSDTSHSGLIGPNLLGASLTATLLDITYTPQPVITEAQQLEIENANLQLEEAQLQIEFLEEELKGINLAQIEEIETFEFAPQLLELEEIEIKEIKIEEFEKMFEANFKEILIEENLIEEFETALVEVSLNEEEFFEEATNMVMEEMKEEFGPNVTFIEEKPQEVKEEKMEEINEETPMTEEVKEEKQEETLIAQKPKEEMNETNATTTESMEETPNESAETGETSEAVSTESDVAEDKETESETTETSNEEGVEGETTSDVKSNVRTKTEIEDIEKKVERVIAKVLSKLKKVDQQLAAIQFIKTQGISSGGADISGYINKKVYNNQKQLEEIPFYSNQNWLEQSQIYGDKSLVKYTSNDPILQQQVALVNVQSEINTLRSEIYALKESIK